MPQDSERSCVSLQNLLPERQYKFRIRAENIYGIGEPSAESEPVTMGLVDDGKLLRIGTQVFRHTDGLDFNRVTTASCVRLGLLGNKGMSTFLTSTAQH